MSEKSLALEAIHNLPEDVSLRDIQAELAYLAAVRNGLEQVERGQTLSLGAVEQKISIWASK